jgi:hypothetical protein
VQTRCEVRYCLPGVGVGVEFVGIAPRDEKAIRKEIQEFSKPSSRKKTTNRAGR